MIFLSKTMFCADVMSAPCTPTDMDDITTITLSDGWYDDLRVTKNTTEPLSSAVNRYWDWDTILHAKFNGNPSAGNVDWNFREVSHLLIKRKSADEFQWITLDVRSVSEIEDFNLKNIDLTAVPNREYQYAAVPIINGMEGFYFKDDVTVRSHCLFIADRGEVWCTNITDNYLDNTSVVPNSVVTTMYDRYPTIVSNSAANYEEITVNAQFFPTGEDECSVEIYDDKNRIEYTKKAKLFLRNGKPKILKSEDGNAYLVYIHQPPSDTASDTYQNRKLSFGAVEIGDINSEEDLWEAGLISETVTEEWWNQ